MLPLIWAGEAELPAAPNGEATGRIEWAAVWLDGEDGFLHTYCNTVPTPLGGTHETGFRAALLKGLRAWGEHRGNRRAAQITAEDVLTPMAAKLSVFLRDPQFQGQTKEKLTSPEATRLVETALRDRFDHWLAGDPTSADNLLAFVIERAEERLRRKESKDTARKSPTRRLRLPGKLTDCTRENAAETEIFLVEGDSAGGSAKQARNRETQAVLPLRGKILNVASASADKLRQNQELKDLIEALGCGVGDRFDRAKLRYGRVIIMTDADVDGAHIASLLMTFFYRELPELVRHGHIYLAQPPLYRLTQGAKSVYAMDDADRERKTRHRVQGRRQGGGQPLQGAGRDAAVAIARNHDGPGEAHAAEGGGAAGGAGADQRAGGKPDGPPAGAALRVHPGAGEDGGGAGCVIFILSSTRVSARLSGRVRHRTETEGWHLGEDGAAHGRHGRAPGCGAASRRPGCRRRSGGAARARGSVRAVPDAYARRCPRVDARDRRRSGGSGSGGRLCDATGRIRSGPLGAGVRRAGPASAIRSEDRVTPGYGDRLRCARAEFDGNDPAGDPKNFGCLG